MWGGGGEEQPTPCLKPTDSPFFWDLSRVLSYTWSSILKIKHEAMPSIPPFYFGTCEDRLSLRRFATLCGLEVKTGHSSQWEKRLEAAFGSRLTFLKWLSTHSGDKYIDDLYTVSTGCCVSLPALGVSLSYA